MIKTKIANIINKYKNDIKNLECSEDCENFLEDSLIKEVIKDEVYKKFLLDLNKNFFDENENLLLICLLFKYKNNNVNMQFLQNGTYTKFAEQKIEDYYINCFNKIFDENENLSNYINTKEFVDFFNNNNIFTIKQLKNKSELIFNMLVQKINIYRKESVDLFEFFDYRMGDSLLSFVSTKAKKINKNFFIKIKDSFNFDCADENYNVNLNVDEFFENVLFNVA